MNRDEVKELLELVPEMQAFADGKDVQFESEFEQEFAWTTEHNPTFNSTLRWRVKPEPRVFWIDPALAYSEEEYKKYTEKYCGKSLVKVTENLSDD